MNYNDSIESKLIEVKWLLDEVSVQANQAIKWNWNMADVDNLVYLRNVAIGTRLKIMQALKVYSAVE